MSEDFHAIFLRALSAYHNAPVGVLGVGRDQAADVIAKSFSRISAENERLRADALTLIDKEPVASCEGCGAWLLEADDFVSDPDGECSGCWAAMTDLPSKRERPCYAYRVGKPNAAHPAHAGES